VTRAVPNETLREKNPVYLRPQTDSGPPTAVGGPATRSMHRQPPAVTFAKPPAITTLDLSPVAHPLPPDHRGCHRAVLEEKSFS